MLSLSLPGGVPISLVKTTKGLNSDEEWKDLGYDERRECVSVHGFCLQLMSYMYTGNITRLLARSSPPPSAIGHRGPREGQSQDAITIHSRDSNVVPGPVNTLLVWAQWPVLFALCNLFLRGHFRPKFLPRAQSPRSQVCLLLPATFFID